VCGTGPTINTGAKRMSADESTSLSSLKEAEIRLQREQQKNPNRAAAIAMTHIQTAILWLEKEKSLQS
jgi:hypothetical protein